MLPLTTGSLFSGLDGIGRGLEAAGVAELSFQCEIDEFCRLILEQEYPGIPKHEDVRLLRGPIDRHRAWLAANDPERAPAAIEVPRVGLLCGGFPCQDISSAGKGAGLSGSRSGLWFEYARLVFELEPEWVIVENVASGAKRWVDAVTAHLGELGYEVLPIPISASDVGAPHLRARVLLVARYTHRDRKPARPRDDQEMARVSGDPECANPPDADGVNGGARRARRTPTRAALGRPEAPQGEAAGEPSGAAADSDSQLIRFQPGRCSGPNRKGSGVARKHGAEGAAPYALCEGLQGAESATCCDEWPEPAWGPWAADEIPEPAICRVDDGIPDRLQQTIRNLRLKALGNSAVPQCIEIAGWVIREIIEQEQGVVA